MNTLQALHKAGCGFTGICGPGFDSAPPRFAALVEQTQVFSANADVDATTRVGREDAPNPLHVTGQVDSKSLHTTREELARSRGGSCLVPRSRVELARLVGQPSMRCATEVKMADSSARMVLISTESASNRDEAGDLTRRQSRSAASDGQEDRHLGLNPVFVPSEVMPRAMSNSTAMLADSAHSFAGVRGPTVAWAAVSPGEAARDRSRIRSAPGVR